MKINLTVPFKEKDNAKSLGAKWDGKTWYVEDDVNLKSFSRWMPKKKKAPKYIPVGKSYPTYEQIYGDYDSSVGQEILQRYVFYMSDYKFLINHRPEWLEGLEIDVYFPDLKCGIEFNGIQHYIETKMYGDPSKQIENDNRKKELCKQNGVSLISITANDLTSTTIFLILSNFNTLLVNRSKMKRNKWDITHINENSSKYRKAHPVIELHTLTNTNRTYIKT